MNEGHAKLMAAPHGFFASFVVIGAVQDNLGAVALGR
jgi:hypothetical protein